MVVGPGEERGGQPLGASQSHWIAGGNPGEIWAGCGGCARVLTGLTWYDVPGENKALTASEPRSRLLLEAANQVRLVIEEETKRESQAA